MGINLENLEADMKRYEENKKIKENQNKNNVFIHEKTGLQFKLKPRKVDVFFKDENITFIPLKHNGLSLKSEAKTDKAVTLIIEKTELEKKDIEDAIYEIEGILLDREEDSKSTTPKSFKEILSDKPNNLKALIDLGQAMSEKFNIKRTKEGKYFYKKDFMQPLDWGIYQKLIEDTFGLHLSKNDVIKSMESISGVYEERRELWEFSDNYYLNTENYTIKQLEPQLTSRKFIHNEKLLKYNPEVEIDNGEEATLMEQTLRQILIPLEDSEDDELFKDFLYFVGWSLINGNVGKNIIIYYNKNGNNGKSVLGKILKCVFTSKLVMVQPQDFNDTFFNARIDDTNIILIDEILSNSLNGKWDLLKKIAGGQITDNIREMYSDTRREALGKGTLFIMTNELPEIPINDTALLYRLLIYELPNKFVNNPNPTGSNELPMNLQIFQELEDDRDGLEWLINMSIKRYLEGEFIRQDDNTTKEIISRDNFIQKWLIENTCISEYKYISNKELVEFFCNNSNYESIYSKNAIAQRIGTGLKDIYGSKLETYRLGVGMSYNIEIR